MTRIMLPTSETICEAAQLIMDGQPVAVPTETVYGLAGNATNAEAIAAIYAAKGRPAFNPLIVHVIDLAAATQLAVFDNVALALANAFWPGPLTLVLPRRADCPVAALATAGLPTIAIRVPAHPVMRSILIACAVPLAAPSANISGGLSPTTGAHVATSLNGRISLIVAGGPCTIGLESTIIAITDGQLRLLRPGAIAAEQIAQATGLIVHLPRNTNSAIIEAPGQLLSHYAPRKQLILNVTTHERDAYHIGFGQYEGDINLSKTGSLTEAAAQLFEALHIADAAPLRRITIAPISAEGLGVAINDRLARAATPR